MTYKAWAIVAGEEALRAERESLTQRVGHRSHADMVATWHRLAGGAPPRGERASMVRARDRESLAYRTLEGAGHALR